MKTESKYKNPDKYIQRLKNKIWWRDLFLRISNKHKPKVSHLTMARLTEREGIMQHIFDFGIGDGESCGEYKKRLVASLKEKFAKWDKKFSIRRSNEPR